MVFQDPHAALNPAMTIAQSVGHPLQIHRRVKTRDEMLRQVAATLEQVGLSPAETYMDKYPGDLSGGQKQRAVIARAIVLDPVLLVADEPVSMLDMSVRSKILQLMIDLKDKLGLTYLYITHDLATAKFFCDRIAILYLGKIVEIGEARGDLRRPPAPLYAGAAAGDPRPRSAARNPARPAPGRDPRRRQTAAWLRLPPALPARICPLRLGAARPMDLLEARWAGMAEADHQAERALVGQPEIPDGPEETSTLHAAPGASGAQLLQLLEKIRETDLSEPFWTGVKAMRAEGEHVAIDWHTAVTPRLHDAGRVQAACHLLDKALTARFLAETVSA